MKRKLLEWLPALLWMGVIFALSAQATLPTPSDHNVDFTLKKSAHFITYSLLALLLLYANRGKEWPLRGRSFIVAFAITAIYAAGDEYHQSFVPPRGASVTDVMLDSFAGAVALLTARWLLLRFGHALERVVGAQGKVPSSSARGQK